MATIQSFSNLKQIRVYLDNPRKGEIQNSGKWVQSPVKNWQMLKITKPEHLKL